MRVATKLAGGFGLLIAVLVALMAYHVSTIHEVVNSNRQLSSISARVSLSSTEQLNRLDQLQENASKYAVTGDEGYARKFDDLLTAFDRAVHDLESRGLSPEEREELERLEAMWDEFVPEQRQLEVFLADIADPGRAESSLAALNRGLDRLRQQTRYLHQASQSAMMAQIEGSVGAAREAERLSWMAVAGALLFSVLISVVIVRSISDSLHRLKEGTRAVAEGNFAYRLDEYRDDEFAQLASDFNIMTRRLGMLDRAKRDFLSKVSHDLKTPLASMQETIQLLLVELPGSLNDKQRKLLDLNLRSGKRLSSMIAKLLDLSKMEADAIEYDIKRHDLVPIVQLVAEEREASLEEREIDIETVILEDSLPVECDGDRVIQVLENLLENALKFSPDGSRIELRARRAERLPEEAAPGTPALRDPPPGTAIAVIEVTDSGPGVPEAEKEKIFERFQQSDNGKRSSRGSVGLGLAICREIVNAHEGVIRVRDAPGGGSVFSVYLPRALREMTAPETAGSADDARAAAPS